MTKNPFTTRLFLVRHGETTANQEQRWYGALDSPLSPRGELQVASTAERFGAWRSIYSFDRLFVSPLSRARTTASAIGAALDLAPVIDTGLREFTIGDWEGRTYRDLIDTERLWERWAADPDFAPPNGESPRSFGLRVVGTVQGMATDFAGETIVVVSHGAVIAALLDRWLGRGRGEWAKWDSPNCAVTLLERIDGAWHGVLVNNTAHLSGAALADEAPAYLSQFAVEDRVTGN